MQVEVEEGWVVEAGGLAVVVAALEVEVEVVWAVHHGVAAVTTGAL